MRFLCMNRRGTAWTAAAAVGLAAAVCILVQGRLANETHRLSPGLQALAEGETSGPEEVKVCDAQGGDPKGTLVVTAEKNSSLKFRCGSGSALSPAKSPEFADVYRYTEREATKACNSTEAVPLNTTLQGAKLTEQQPEELSGGSRNNPFYVFQYNADPLQDLHLCYTCNTTSGVANSETLNRTVTATQTVACTVYIKVPRKEEEKPPTNTSTTAPASTSAAHAAPVAAATSLGVLLAVLPRP